MTYIDFAVNQSVSLKKIRVFDYQIILDYPAGEIWKSYFVISTGL